MSAYHWLTIAADDHRFLRPVFAALGVPSMRAWTESAIRADAFSRTVCDGLVTAVGAYQGRTIAIAWSDFRVRGACYSQANSRRFSAFLRHLHEADGPSTPLIYVVNSQGVSLMEGRKLFSDAFRLWPDLLAYGERHLLLTCATGKCLGLAPLLFGLGHYRVAVADHTRINLTGPEVIAMFFGRGVDFDQRAAAERFVERNDLVHELLPSLDAALARLLSLIVPRSGSAPALGPKSAGLLRMALDGPPEELIPGWCPRVRLFLGAIDGTRVGVFLNPPERSDNMITIRALEKYAAGLDLFRALRVPIVSFLDSPGLDPRFEQSDANNIRKALAVGARIIRYPYGSMGVVTGRCFGGAASLGFPKVFGGHRAVALRGATFGTMCGAIIDRLLSQSARLREEWRATAEGQGSACEDLMADGTLDAVIEPEQLRAELERFVAEQQRTLPERHPAARLRVERGGARRRGRGTPPVRVRA